MPTLTLHVTDRDGAARAVEVQDGQSLMRALRGKGYDLQAICGGVASCATCHVFIAPEWRGRLARPEEDEIAMVEDTSAYEAGASRLSCQIPLTPALDGLTLTIAPED